MCAQQNEPKVIRLAVGTAVAWDASPTGFAQIEILHRTHVTIGYMRKGQWRRVRIHARRVVIMPILFDQDNPFGRGVWPRSKSFTV
jgi:hypothetical protein